MGIGVCVLFTRSLTVLDDHAPLLPHDQVVCDAPPFILRPLPQTAGYAFEWQDGSTESAWEVQMSGLYRVQATDGYCHYHDSLRLDFLEDIAPGVLLHLPEDTTLCNSHFPYSLAPYSEYTDTFLLNGSHEFAQVLPLHASGQYTVGAMIAGCEVVGTFTLEADACEAPVYLPNAFSPNADGINDRLFPQGDDFDMLELSVFDRWGNLLHHTTAAPFHWNGSTATQPAGEGVYMIAIRYLNRKTGYEESKAQEVVLMR
ncbi:MAG: gliding motility-associated C-terminal domain-containing protein [Saprospiraceae bacterium]